MIQRTAKIADDSQEPIVLPVAPTMQMILAAPPESGIRIDFPGKLSVRSILGKLRPRVQRRLPHLSCGGD